MHDWGQEDVDWEGINDAAWYIAGWLRTWARLPVADYKEKFGTVRISCGFGWSQIYSIWRPHYHWVPTWWPHRFDLWLSYHTPLLTWINKIIIPIHKAAYVWRYKKAVQKWPHLYKEIVSQADWGELFDGEIPGYKHSDFWRTVK